MVFEGQGYICENKHKNARKKWEKVPIIVTSNKLPYILTEAANKKEEDHYDYVAFQARIKFHKLTKSFKNRDCFPCNVFDLARYMYDKVMEVKKK